jgi:DNA-binding FadR family transcriptional regulator
MARAGDAPRASDRVHQALRELILAGELAPGDPVPSERALAERYGVHRQPVREALKRLEQAGLVQISHGGATRVLDWRDAGGLEILADLAGSGGDLASGELARSIIEMRRSVGVDAAQLCCERASDDELARIGRLADAAAALVGGEPERLEDGYAAMWRAIVAGSDNVAYRLAFNSLMRALPSRPGLAEAVRPDEADAIRSLGRAIVGRDAGRAADAARVLLTAAIS